ncbi:unnamed protein product [Schistosoma bovis]|nr:unnamed protein product [Schistosoma bovis]CAH8542160.1 unnamed protein product [Schistosoma bovis]
MIDLPFPCRNEQCMNNNTNTINNGNSSMNTNSYKDTTLNPNILPLLKHQLPRQELNESYTKKKCQYQPKSSCSITSNHSFKFNQDYNKNKLDNVIEHSTIQQINNKLKCHYIQNKLDTIHNPIVYYSNLTTNDQKYKNIYKTSWNHQYKRISTLKSRKYKKKKNLLKSTNKFNKNNLIHLKSKLMKNEYFNKNLPYKSINPIHKTNQIKTRNIENFLHQTVHTTTTNNNNTNSNNNSSSNNNNQDGDNLHNKIFESINTIYSNYAFNPFKTSITNQNNNFENKINDILKPRTSSNEINQIVHCSNLLKKNNYLSSSLSSSSSSSSGSSSILTLPQLSSHLSPLPIKSLYDNEKLYLKQNNIRKHFQKLTNSIFNYNYTSNPIYSNSHYSINNDKPLDLRNPLQIHLNTMLYKNKNYNNNNTNDKLFNEIEKLGKAYLSMGNFNSNEIWSTIFTLLNRKLNQFSQINQSKFHSTFFKTNLYG